MTVPGVNVITAATLPAAVGDIRRFRSPRKLVGYLGLDPKVRQSGPGPATHGRISKQGSAPARYALVEAARSVVRQPGPMHAFYERIRSRRRHQVAIVASARRLAVLFWHLLTKEQDYAYPQPSLTRKKLRRLELLAGAQKGQVRPGDPGREQGDQQARARARRAGRARLPAQRPRSAGDEGRERDTETRIFKAAWRQAARHGTGPRPCALARRRSRPGAPWQSRPPPTRGLDFHPSRKAALTALRFAAFASSGWLTWMGL
jgi:hypothetical protein